MSGSDECKKMIPEVEIVVDSDKIRILMHEIRRDILAVMKEKHNRLKDYVSDWSVKELSQVLKISPQRIYHHIDKLLEGGFVYKCRDEKIGRTITSFYRRSAKRYVIDYEVESDSAKEMLSLRGKEMVEQLINWYDIVITEDERKTLESLFPRLLNSNSKVITRVSSKLKDGYNPHQIPINIRLIMNILSSEDESYIQTLKELNKILEAKFR